MNTMEKKNTILQAFNTRHATKSFDPAKKISDEDFEFILETARLSPSSLGYEPWKFLIVQNSELREKIRKVSFGAQGQLPTASHFVIILAKSNARTDSEYVQRLMIDTKKVPSETLLQMSQAYQSFQENDILDSEGLLEDRSYQVSVMAAFGYRTQEPSRVKNRREYDSVIQWIK